MLFNIDIWLLPAITAGAASYLICLAWEHFKKTSTPNGILATLLSILSFIIGGLSAYFRYIQYKVSLENNIIVMFTAAAVATFFWLLLRKYFPNTNRNSRK